MNMNVNSYTIEELLDMLELENPSDDDIVNATEFYKTKFRHEENEPMYDFMVQVQRHLLDFLESMSDEESLSDNEENIDAPKNLRNLSLPANKVPEIEEEAENDIELEAEDLEEDDASEKTSDKPSEFITETKKDTKVDFVNNNHSVLQMSEEKRREQYTVPVSQGVMNPNLKNTVTKMINIDSQYRQDATMYNANGNRSTSFNIDLSEPLSNVLHMRMYSLQIPYAWYVFDEAYGTNIFWIETENGVYDITFDSGNYSIDELTSVLNQVTINSQQLFTFSHNKNTGKVSVSLDASVRTITFYDITKNAAMKRNNNLGWMLGFREQSYSNLSDVDVSWNHTGEAIADIYGTKYIMIYLDDFNQNRVNSNLVNIQDTRRTKLSVPNYFARDMSHNTTDDGVFQVFPEAPRKLTQNQIYAINEIYANKKIDDSQTQLSAPSTSDIFCIVPVKRNNMAVGDAFIEYGGSLQVNERSYFGPVQISRFKVQLLDDKGNIMNLNGCDWSFGMVCEMLYQY
jgi:hypothetical protein